MKRPSLGQALLLASLIVLLILTAVWAVSVMDKHGWIALGPSAPSSRSSSDAV